jgi:hypothetical protein
MDEANFWEVVQLAHDQSGGDMEEKCEAVRNHISKLSTEEAQHSVTFLMR